MITANMHEAKSQLSKLIERAEAGEEVVIARNGKPAVRLTPVNGQAERSQRNILGALRGQIWICSDEEMAEADREIERLFNDGPLFPGEDFAPTTA